jgi:hypothetical protein
MRRPPAGTPAVTVNPRVPVVELKQYSVVELKQYSVVDFPLQRENGSAWCLTCLPLFASEEQER